MSRRVALGDRGRVPFALVGVLLVVTSALFAAGIDLDPGPPEPAVDLTMERTAADTRAALRQASSRAAVAAASEPVVTPADTPAGRALANGSGDPFERALRLRIYLAARERFASIERTHRGVAGTVSLPRPASEKEVARAISRVDVSAEGENGERLRVTIHNVTQTADHGGDVAARRNLTVTVVVDSPVLAVHDRVEEFQRRLDAGMMKPGLTQKVTARLYAVAWARGYAQYGGAPIGNVVSNQHVSLLTNGAVLGVQRSVFGRSDPDARRAHGNAVGRAALTSVVGQAPDSVSPLGTLLEEQLGPTSPAERQGVTALGSEADPPAPNDTTQVHVGQTAVEAFMPFTCRPAETPGRRATSVGECKVDGVMRNVLNFTTDRVYRARIRTLAATEETENGTPARPGRPDAPGEWDLEDSFTRSRGVNVEPATTDFEVSVPDGYHVLFAYERRVTVRYSHVAVWDGENRTFDRLTYNNATGSKLVRVVVVGRHAPVRHAPDNPIDTVHEPASGAGDNLADVRDQVNETVVADRGGPAGLAEAAALGRLDTGVENVSAAPPANASERFYPELVALREEIRAINVTVRKGEGGTYDVNPAGRLAGKVEGRREALVGAPDEYDTVAEKAKYELRAMYVERVVRELETRARRHRDQESGFAGAISEATGVSLGTVRDSTEARRVEGGGDDRAVRYRVDGAPPYLTMAEVTHGDVAAVPENESVYPLKAENVNVFTIPYGDATDGAIEWVAGLAAGDPKTRLRTGAQAARSAQSAADASGNESVRAARMNLSAELNTSLRTVKRQMLVTLRSEGVAETDAQRRAIVDRTFARWDGPRREALAVANGTAVDAVVAEATAADVTDLSEMDRDILRIRLRNSVSATLDSRRGTVSGPVVAAATSEVKGAVGNYTQGKLREGIEQQYNRSISSMPAGLPIAPVPGYWAVTANVWVVNVKGEYERFAVETPRRTPAPGDASLSYVRDGANVTLDVDGDGTEELLGRSDAVGFDVTTAVVVVVPAGGTGVGDVDGNLQERSPGWERVVQQRRSNGSAMGNETDARTPSGYWLVTTETPAEARDRPAANETD